jgi:hypothetical protein
VGVFTKAEAGTLKALHEGVIVKPEIAARCDIYIDFLAVFALSIYYPFSG